MKKETNVTIAIDGPAGAGKTTTAKAIAEKLGIRYVDTGAIYRAAAIHLLRKDVSPEDPEETIREALEDLDVRLDGATTYLGDEDVSFKIRTEEATDAASRFSALPAVRAALFGIQRRLATETSSVTEGRDVGTTVLPDADLKIFLTADLDERAARRWTQRRDANAEAGIKEHESFAKIKDALAKRDERDSTRVASPLREAEDSVRIDSTSMTVEEVVDEIARLAEAALEAKKAKNADDAATIPYEDVRALAYRAYVIDWEKKIDARRKAEALMEAAWWKLEDLAESLGGPEGAKAAQEEWVDEAGYQGELYVCYEEFLGAEYLDEDYVRGLFLIGNPPIRFLDDLTRSYESDPIVVAARKWCKWA